MKQLITFLLFLSLAGCTTNNDIEGYWYIKDTDTYHDVPMLLYFQNDLCIDYSSANIDTFRCVKKLFSNVVHLIDEKDSLYYTVQKENKDFKLYQDTTTEFYFLYKKSTKDKFVLEYLKNKDVKISLPKGRGWGHKTPYNQIFRYPLYIGLNNNKVFFYTYDSLFYTYKELFECLSLISSENFEIEEVNFIESLNLIVDKNIKYGTVRVVKDLAFLSNLRKINLIVDSKKYHDINYLTIKSNMCQNESFLNNKYASIIDSLKILYRPPLPPCPEPLMSDKFPSNGIFVTFINDTLKINHKLDNFKSFKNEFQKRKKNGEKPFVTYYIEDEATYQDYINVVDSMINTFLDLRDDYLMEKYGIKYRGLENEELRIDAHKAVRIAISEVDSIWYHDFMKLRNKKQ